MLVDLVDRAERLGVHGLLFQHSALCDTRVWLHHRRVDCAHLNRFMQRGLWVDRTTYTDVTDHVSGVGIRPDQINWPDRTVSEVKSSRRPTDAARLQLLFYMAVLTVATCTSWTGVLRFPATRRIERLTLDEQARVTLGDALDQIAEIIARPSPPAKSGKPICSGCSYRLLCWGLTTEDET